MFHIIGGNQYKMANVVIVKTGNDIDVDFGVYANDVRVDGRRASYQPQDIAIVWLQKDDAWVNIQMKVAITTPYWEVNYDGSDGKFQVDSVDGVTPTDNVHLYELLKGLK
jgi:hypothetical protein